jgi:hypothetical protein
MGVWRREENDCIDEHSIQISLPRLGCCKKALQRPSMAAELEQRGCEWGTALWIPLRAIDIDQTAGTFDINQIKGMGSQNSYIYLEGLISALDLEVVDDQVAIRQLIPQMGNRQALCVVDGVANGDHCGH